MVQRQIVWFSEPRKVEVRQEPLAGPGDHEVLVKTEMSAISAGTEMLVFRGELPGASDAGPDLISRGLSYPTPYGYCAVGQVVDIGSAVDRTWLDRTVLGFQPHASHFLTSPDSLLPLPPGIGAPDAVFAPNLETAVNLVQDTAPMLGERILVLGQGVVGLLATALLREFPLDCLVTSDRFLLRRQASEALGVKAALDPADPDFHSKALAYAKGTDGYDASLELTGSPSALDSAIALTMFSGRIVVGSWFGSKRVSLDLGSRFHRSRIRLVASQVSTIAPEMSGRWDKARRFAIVWEAMKRIRPGKWITHRVPVEHAAEAYRLLDESPGEAIQLVFQYA